MKDTNTGVDNTGENNSGDWNSGNWNSGNWNSGVRNSGDGNSGDGNSGNWNSGVRNSGYGNSTDRESGIFCSEQGTVRMFNKPTNLKWEEINHPDFSDFKLNEWVSEDDMTDEEKKSEPNFYVMKGYLKTISWNDAWTKFWLETNEENRQKVLDLPNFDAVIFKDITGIDVAVKEEMITLSNGNQVSLSTVEKALKKHLS